MWNEKADSVPRSVPCQAGESGGAEKNTWQRNGKREAVQRKAGGAKKGGQIVFQTILIKTIYNSNLICPVVTRCGLSPQLWMLLYMLVSVVVHC